MGGTPINEGSSSSSGGAGQNGLGGINQELDSLIQLLTNIFAAGQSNTNTDLITFTTHNVAQAMYPNSKKVKWALIQNITNTDIITLFAISNLNGNPPSQGQLVNYKGTILNPSGTADQAGGSYPTFNVDLSNIAVICDTTDGVVGLSVTYGY
jgi:hypothetical protein